MKEKTNRKIWQTPWGYPESITVTCGIMIVGFLLQITIGNFNFYLLAVPVNIFVGSIIALLCIASLFISNSHIMRWFTGIPISVCLITAQLILTLIMGLTPQVASKDISNIFIRLGFNSMTSSWAFVLIYLFILLSLGSLIVRKFRRFRLKDYAFYMNHIGLWLVLFAAGLGYADMERYIMHVEEGKTEWRVYDDDGNVKELPIAIKLNDFDMEEQPRIRFMSDVEVYTPDGNTKKGILEVNKPIRTGNWTVYQYGYDNYAGRLSSYSSMELVYDPWVIPVYTGFILIALGSMAMIWNGRLIKRRADTNDNNKQI
jgi:hypothetical protein